MKRARVSSFGSPSGKPDVRVITWGGKDGVSVYGGDRRATFSRDGEFVSAYEGDEAVGPTRSGVRELLYRAWVTVRDRVDPEAREASEELSAALAKQERR